MKNYKTVITLLNQIIEYNYLKDQLNKEKEETGLDWNTHHLKLLKDLITENEE
jgi:hypothetical protein